MKLYRLLPQALLAAVMCVTAFAQDDDKDKDKDKNMMTITGCLDKGASSGQYMLTDNSGKSWTVMPGMGTGTAGARTGAESRTTGEERTPAAQSGQHGAGGAHATTADLDKHAMRHTVRLHGKQETSGGQQIFRVHRIEHVSDTCSTVK